MAIGNNLPAKFQKLAGAFDAFSSSDLKLGAGKVLDYVYHRGYYKVAGPGGSGEDIALVELGSLRADGNSRKESIPIGSCVFYIYSPTFSVGYIIGSFGEVRTGDPSASMPAVNFRVTAAKDLFEPTNLDGSPHVVMAGDHVPMDLAASAFARTNPYGGALVLDNHFLLANVREGVGITALEDGTVQISGETVFIRSFLKEYKEFKNKYGTDGVEDVFLSVATGLGYASTADMSEVVTKEDTNADDETIVEPQRLPMPFASKHSGETAEGFSTVVRAYKDKTRDSGVPLFRQTIHRDGSFILQSASQVILEKFCLIEDPLARKETPDDEPTTAKPLEFKHKQTSKISAISAMNSEYLSYLLGTKIPRVQKRFWTVNDTKKIAETLAISSAVVNNPSVRSLPAVAQVLIDLEKNTSRDIYGSRSGIYLTDDGSVLIKDGYGSSITMGRGSIVMSPAKDMVFQVGQDIVSIAGGEINSVAMKGVTITSEDAGLSLNAKDFLNIRSTAPDAGILIESLATKDKKDDKGKPVGVVIRAADSVVSTVAARVESNSTYTLHTSSDYQVDSTSVSLFAESGIKLIPQKLTANISDKTPGVFVVNGQTIVSTGLYLSDSVNLNGSLTVDGSLLLSGQLTCLGSGAFQSEPSAMPQRAIDQLRKSITQIFEALGKNVAAMSRVYEKQRLQEVKRLSDLYLAEINRKALLFKSASAKKIPYELAQAEWQRYSTAKLPTIDPVTSGAPVQLLTKGIFWTVKPVRVEDTGAYKNETDQVKETELEKKVTATEFTINVSDEEYKRSPYDKD